MSHFSTFYTSMNKEPVLVEALQLLGHLVEQDQELTVTGQHGIEHETVTAELAIGKDIGFRLNPTTGNYELVADIETWNQDVPIERFIEKVKQQYSRMLVHNTVTEMGFKVEEEWEMDDNSIELTVSRWV